MISYWLWFWIITTPFLMFYAKPSSSRWARMGRSAAAFMLGYFVTFGLYYIYYKLYPSEYRRSIWHWLILGWLYIITYIGWLEIAWRIRYRKQLVSLHKGMGDDWISGKMIVISIVLGTWLFLIYMTVIIHIIKITLKHYGIISS